MTGEIYAVKFLLGLLILIKASQLDLKERRVPNVYWKVFAIVMTPLLALEFLELRYTIFTITLAAFQFAFVSLLAYLLYRIGAYGGADAKAIITLAYAFPVYPSVYVFPLINKSFSFSFSTLSNAVVVAPILALYLFFTNVAREGVRGIKGNLLYYFVARKVSVENFPRFYNLLEFVENGEIKRVKRGVEANEEILNELKRLGVKEVWATPALPFLVFITAGYVFAFIFGDALLFLVQNALR